MNIKLTLGERLKDLPSGERAPCMGPTQSPKRFPVGRQQGRPALNIKLTLGERLKDLRVERNLKLETLAEQTGLSKSALSKYESDDVTDLSIYAVTTLAEFYGVTTDYLLGVTENKKRPDAVLSDLHLSDGAVDVLRNGKFNHRLLCELIVHENFQRFMTDLEIYVDGYVSANIQNLNAGLEATRQMLKKKYAADENDLYMSTLKLGQIYEDEYFGWVAPRPALRF